MARQSAPWLALSVALVIATIPAWQPWFFGVTLSLDDLLAMRCLPWR